MFNPDYRCASNGVTPLRGGAAPARAHYTPGAVRLSIEAAAEYLGTTVNTMRSWRTRGQGPRWYKHMGRVAYDVTDLDAFKAERAKK